MFDNSDVDASVGESQSEGASIEPQNPADTSNEVSHSEADNTQNSFAQELDVLWKTQQKYKEDISAFQQEKSKFEQEKRQVEERAKKLQDPERFKNRLKDMLLNDPVGALEELGVEPTEQNLHKLARKVWSKYQGQDDPEAIAYRQALKVRQETEEQSRTKLQEIEQNQSTLLSFIEQKQREEYQSQFKNQIASSAEKSLDSFPAIKELYQGMSGNDVERKDKLTQMVFNEAQTMAAEYMRQGKSDLITPEDVLKRVEDKVKPYYEAYTKRGSSTMSTEQSKDQSTSKATPTNVTLNRTNSGSMSRADNFESNDFDEVFDRALEKYKQGKYK